jgi:hypothetical protein
LVALEALRKIQAAVIVGHVAKVKARLPSMPAFFLLNNKRADITALEAEHGVQILILPDGRLRPDEYEFEMEGVKDQHAKAAEGPTDGHSDSTRSESSDSQQTGKSSSEESGEKQRNKRAGGSPRQPVGGAAV